MEGVEKVAYESGCARGDPLGRVLLLQAINAQQARLGVYGRKKKRAYTLFWTWKELSHFTLYETNGDCLSFALCVLRVTGTCVQSAGTCMQSVTLKQGYFNYLVVG